MKVSCVVDNRADFNSDFYAEHGLSLLVEKNDENILMDTGKTPVVLKHNLELLGIESVDKVVLSHGHNDHTGGISSVSLLKENKTKFYMHPEALTPKYAVHGDESRYIGFPQNIDPSILRMNWDRITETTKIGRKIWVFNHVEDHCNFETIPNYLRIKKDDEFLNDHFMDELNLVIKTDNGLVVLSGCAHHGIVNILYSAREYFQDEIHGVIGGSHLVQATPQRIEKTVDEIKKLDPQVIALGHCTGFKALCRFSKHFKDEFIPLASGVEITALK